jgi:uncharacterized repeat protein (TIGR01451 family)
MKFILRCLLLLIACLAVPGIANADTDITLFKSFAGNVNFVGAQRTLRKAANGTNACSVYAANETTSADLSGIPANAKILSAHLYWAASGSTTDYQVVFDGTTITAPAARQYQSGTVGYDFFSGAYDITAQVTAKRNATYTFSGLSIDNGNKWCNVEGVLGGWSMLVVYSLPTEIFRVLNIYEGFKYIQNSNISLTLSNFEVPPLTAGQTGRVAHITWEGDATLSGTSQQEYLTFNGYSLYNSANPNGNQFNSVSTISGTDSASYGIDFDAYTVSSPVIQAGQTSATTVYSSSQDLVLLSAEVIAVPNTPVSDLGITMSRDQALTLGQTALYTLSVKNYGPAADQGTVQVVDTLPAALSYVYGGGDGWSCSISGQKITCNYTQPLDVGATAPELMLTVMVNLPAGTVTNTATVDGAAFDNQMNNNTASDTTTIQIAPYVFTNGSCTHGVAFGTAGQCAFIDWRNAVAGDSLGFYVTLVNSTGVPTRASNTVNTTINMKFAMTCVNPLKGSSELASFPDTASFLPKCAESGATPTTWTTLRQITIPSTKPSTAAAMSFTYYDVGRIKMFMQDDSAKTGGTGPVVMKPWKVDMEIYKNLATGRYDNPAAQRATDPRFVSAGEQFTIRVGVRTRDKNNAPYYAQNFGQETSPRDVDLVPDVALDPDSNANPKSPFAELINTPVLQGTLGAFSLGRSSGVFSYGEVGIIKASVALSGNDYLGTGSVTGSNANIGRFTPDHFNTVVEAASTTGNVMPCSAGLTNCPVGTAGMVYSRRQFVTTFTVYDAAGNLLKNYRGRFAKNLYVCAATDQLLAPPGGTVCPILTGTTPAPYGSLRDGSATADDTKGVLPIVDGTKFANLSDPTKDSPIAATTNYLMANPWNGVSSSGQTTPTLIYVRVTDSDGISSLFGANASRAIVEGSVVIVNGRVFVPNIFGSELQYLPVNVKAQYWSGQRWVNSDQDYSNIVDVNDLSFANCRKNLLVNGSCKTSALGGVVSTSPPVIPAVSAFNAGLGKFLMKAPGAGNSGTADYYFDSLLGWPLWLPTTVGRATFGVYRNSPVTYVRELY